jgi:hypothetical protein
VVAYFTSYFLRLRYYQGFKTFFNNFWNITDAINTLLYFIYLLLIYIPGSNTESENPNLIKSIQCCIIILTFIKVNFFLQLFEGLSFLVQMINSVLFDLKFFLLYFAIFIATFAALLLVLIDDISYYEGLGPIGYIAIAFRTSVGDFNIDNYAENS